MKLCEVSFYYKSPFCDITKSRFHILFTDITKYFGYHKQDLRMSVKGNELHVVISQNEI